MRRIAAVWLCMLILFSSGFIFPNFIEDATGVDIGGNDVNYIPHAPISISGNADFASQASSEGWPGDGSSGNPYIIENYEIDASSAHGIYITTTSVYFIIKNSFISGTLSFHSIYLYNVQNGRIENCNCTNTAYGIFLYTSSNNTVINNIAFNNHIGIYLHASSNNNIVVNNRVSLNNQGGGGKCGIYVWSSNSNTIYHNDLIDNLFQAYDNTGTNFWDDGYPSGGNYWSDYGGVDIFSGPNQDIPGSDGIGDTPYTNIDGGSGEQDNYPLMAPWLSRPAPDLIVESVWWFDSHGSMNGPIRTGQPFALWWMVKNIGNNTAVGPFNTTLTIDGYQSWSCELSDLNAGESSVDIGPCWLFGENELYIPDNGIWNIHTDVDTTNSVLEINELNNDDYEDQIIVAVTEWTVLAYFAGDSDLEQDFLDKLAHGIGSQGMANWGSTEFVSLVAQIDRHPGYDSRFGDWTDCRRFFIQKDNDPTLSNSIQSWGKEVDMTDPLVLEEFLLWGAGRFEAEKYLIIFGDHGNGWDGCCEDETNQSSGAFLQLPDIEYALNSVKMEIGRNIDIVLFDACLMNAIEVASSVYNYADYMASSETVGYTDTFQYDRLLEIGVIEYLVNNPNVDAETYANEIVDLAVLHDNAGYLTHAVADLDLGYTNELLISVNNLARNLRLNLKTYKPNIQQARENCNEFGNSCVDLYQLCEKLQSYVPVSSIQNSAQNVMDIIGPDGGAPGYFIYNERDTPTMDFCRGISIFFPEMGSLGDYYDCGRFVDATEWDEFLEEYNQVIELVMNPGWHLISLPFIQSDETITSVLEGDWIVAQAYDPTHSNPWRSFNINRPAELNDLNTINHKIGIWVYYESQSFIIIHGSLPASTTIPLYPGWNLVGYPAQFDNSYTVGQLKVDTGATSVEGYDLSSPYRISVLSDSVVLEKCNAYWVYVPAYTDWVVDW